MTEPTPQQYIEAGFRILRVHPETKTPLVGGFGVTNPMFCCAAADFRPTERVAILCGPCPALQDPLDEPLDPTQEDCEHLICLDLDHGLTVEEIEAHTGPLPDTLTSKDGAHMYYRVPPSEARDRLRQWTNVLNADDPSQGALDLKWKGGYAIEPGNVPGGWDDGGFDPERIAVLPERAVAAFVALKSRPEGARREVDVNIDESAEYSYEAVEALAALWPQALGEGFPAALALGGVMAQSSLADGQALAFADEVFGLLGCDRIRQYEASLINIRTGADAEVKGWPSLKDSLRLDTPERVALFETFVSGVPGLSRKPEPTADTEAVAGFVEQLADPGFCTDAPVGDDGRSLAVPRGDAVSVAADIVERRCPGSVYADGQLWARPDEDDPASVWTPIAPSQLSRWAAEYSGAICGYSQKGDPLYLSVSYNMIQGVANCIADSQDRPGFFEVPEARIVFQNGVLDVRTREFRPATAEDCVRAALPFDYHEDQLQRHPPKHWSDFVLAQWGEDAECFNLLHQILGYLLSGRMDLEKMFVFLGPPRCGKGTIIKLLQAIMGDTVGTFKIAALDQTFGMSNMLNKSVLVDPDVRKSKSAFKDTGAIAERLLSITSGDKQAVRLMRQAPIDVVLPGRILVATNPPFEMRDDGGALASRVVVLPFNTSHLGSEDPGLLDRLKAEIPSIVALAMSGLTQLDKQGRFTEPARAADVREDIRQSQDPMIEWFEDHYEAKAMPPGEELLVADVYQHACNWRMGEGLRPFSKRALGGFLSKHNIRSKVERRDGKPQRLYFGLKPKGE